MFNRKTIDMSQIVPTSKISLKMSCLTACGNDVERAARLYEFLASDLQDLPDMEPVKLTGMQQVMASADNVIGWINQHQGEIAQGIEMIRSLKGNVSGPVTVAQNLEAIPKI